MLDVVGISFNESSKIYYFSPEGFNLKKGDKVIVDTERGSQLGIVSVAPFMIDPQKLSFALKNVTGLASDVDYKQHLKNLEDASFALSDAIKYALEFGLDMKLLNSSFTFDRKQLLFNFVADDRVDFRNLAKKLAGIYKTRIELRQIGVRDKAREVGGFGQCGRELCCSSFLKDISSVSINMAKNQNLALNPQKINGVCGRLMCCLTYENQVYSECRKGLPRVGDSVVFDKQKGKVIDVDLFKRIYKVEFSDGKVSEVGDK